MPPKSKSSSEQKSETKKKEKVAEDKTFGLKNKNKSKAVQKFIATVKHQVKQVPGQRTLNEQEARSEKKKDTERAALLNSLFGPLGLLEVKKKKKKKEEDDKGKIDLYTDQRDQNTEEDNMANWDQDKLEKVVGQRHGMQAKECQTDIICKFFLDAVEKSLYGWFWVCPNGGDTCKYRHSLPAGYILKKSVAVVDEDEEEEISLEEKIEIERAALPTGGGTPVTEESFKVWLKKREEQKQEALQKEKQAIIDAAKGQRGPLGLSGRDLFAYDPSLFVDDDAAAGQDLYADMTDEPGLYEDDIDDEYDDSDDSDDNDDKEDSDVLMTPQLDSVSAPKVSLVEN